MASQKFSPSLAGEALLHWQMEYEGALQETDHKILFKRIEIAEAALLSRREALLQGPDGHGERQEIKTALDRLRRLKKEVLKFP